ncbi:TIGR02234 family membrane protein [Streptomyces sudanensis]|uniref:TIGR02234 family membrane protein n=1 Tax=Streptomyces sudanensis TaxID=436397 RepID=A0ABY4TCF1_9ACTN|nr:MULTISPECIES: TIGR02234 family membrane protein [Streptomyces]URN15749.1 TIGR02234 family membrane protein [Streptomyces sudanensis]
MGHVSAASVPQPRTARPGGAATAGGARRSLAAALLLGALGAAVVLLASGRVWIEGHVTGVGGTVALRASGGDVTGLPAALAVVGLAALVAVLATRGAGRRVVALLLALSGAGAAAAALLGANDGSVLDERAARTAGDTAARAAGLTQTPWPYVTAAAALLILAAGLIALRHGRSWPAMSGRYERDGGPRAGAARRTGDPDRPEELWKALDRGEDPTDGT